MTDTIERQSQAARRFMQRLAAMTAAERRAIAIPDYNAGPYVSPRLQVHDLVQLAGGDAHDGTPGPTTRMREFAATAERQLERAGVSEDLRVIALEAMRAILVWTMAGAQPAARLVYQPFETAIPYESLLERQPA
jgi:hypothetical protein